MQLMTWVLLLSYPVRAQTAREWFARGADNHNRGDFSTAEHQYRRALEIDPQFFEVHHNLGALLAAQNRWAEAEKAYRQAVRINPAHEDARRGLVMVLFADGRADAATSEAMEYVKVVDSLTSHLLLGRVYLARGRIAEACREMQRAYAFQSLNSAVQLELADCWLRNDDFDAATMHSRAVLRREPQNKVAASLIETIALKQRTRKWIWLPALVSIGALAAFWGARRPERWLQRKLSLGTFAFGIVGLMWLVTNQAVWLPGSLWGLYQFYAAFAHRRTQVRRSGDRVALAMSVARVLGCISLADGDVQNAELRAIRSACERSGFAEVELVVIGQELRQCTADFRAKLFEHEALYATLRDACVEFGHRSNEAMRLALYRDAVGVALCDGPATQGELQVVRACATWLNIPAAAQDDVWRSMMPA
jgi:tetratricopeptide (TPR) repeat protein